MSQTGGIQILRPQPTVLKPGETLGLTLTSDPHIGAANIDYRHIERELQTAKEKGDHILINGDIFDAILPKDMKRFTPGVLHKRLQGKNNVINAALDWAEEIYSPYVDNILMIGVGNHDVAVEKHHGLDPVLELFVRLKRHKKKDNPIFYGGYCGYIDFRLSRETDTAEHEYNKCRWVLFFHHGSGGNAPVTKGAINLNRLGWVNADMKWLGHLHQNVQVGTQALSCPLKGHNPVVKDVRHIITGSYFKTYSGQTQEDILRNGRKSNYAADACLAPAKAGGARVELSLISVRNKACVDVKTIQ